MALGSQTDVALIPPSAPGGSAPRLGRAALAATVGVAASGVTGYGRDAALAARLGAVGRADAFFVAYSWLDLLIGGLPIIIAAVVIPALARIHDDASQRRVSAAMVIAVGVPGVCVAALAAVLAPFVVKLVAPGLAPLDAQESARAMQLMAPGIASVWLTAAMTAMLNYRMIFLAPALGGATYNLILAAGALLAPGASILVIASFASAAAATQTSLMLTLLYRRRQVDFTGWRLGMPMALNAFRLAPPVALGVGLSSVTLLLDRGVASRLGVGSIAELNFAFRIASTLNQMLGSAVAMAAFPLIARSGSARRMGDMSEWLRRSLRLVILVGMPIAAFAIPWRTEIVSLLYVHGAFTQAQAAVTGGLMAIALVGFAIDGCSQPLWRLTFTLGWMRWLLTVSIVQLCVHVVILLVAVPRLGLNGVAAAFTGALALQAVILYVHAVRRTGPIFRLREALRLAGPVTLASASVALGATLGAIATAGASGGWKLVALASSALVGALTALVIGVVLDVSEVVRALYVARAFSARHFRARRSGG